MNARHNCGFHGRRLRMTCGDDDQLNRRIRPRLLHHLRNRRPHLLHQNPLHPRLRIHPPFRRRNGFRNRDHCHHPGRDGYHRHSDHGRDDHHRGHDGHHRGRVDHHHIGHHDRVDHHLRRSDHRDHDDRHPDHDGRRIGRKNLFCQQKILSFLLLSWV